MGILHNTLLDVAAVLKLSNREQSDPASIQSASVDMAAFNAEALTVLTVFGSASASSEVKLQQSNDDGATDNYSDLEGSGILVPGTDDQKVAVHELVKPRKRWVRVVVVRSGAGAEVTSIVALVLGSKRLPVTQDGNVVSGYKVLHSPLEGSA